MHGTVALTLLGETSTTSAIGRLGGESLDLAGSVAESEWEPFPILMSVDRGAAERYRLEGTEQSRLLLDPEGAPVGELLDYRIHVTDSEEEIHGGLWVGATGGSAPFVVVDDPIEPLTVSCIIATGAACFLGLKAAKVFGLCARQLANHRCPNGAPNHTVSSKAIARIAPLRLRVECRVECTVVCRDKNGRSVAKDVTSLGLG